MIAVTAIFLAAFFAAGSPGGRFHAETLLCRILLGLSGVAVAGLGVGMFSLHGAAMLLWLCGLLGLCVGTTQYRRFSLPLIEKDPWSRLCLGVVTVSGVLGMVAAMAPITSWDATVAHAALPAAYVRQGFFGAQPGNVYSGYPQLMHVLYALAFQMQGERGIAWLALGMTALAVVSVYALGRRVAGRKVGLTAAALMATTPLFADQAGIVGIDLPFVAFSTAAATVFLRWRRKQDAWSLMLCALLTGASCGIRHTGWLLALLLGAGVLWYSNRRRLRDASLFCLVLGGMALPWLLRSAWATGGNPLFPFLLSLFPSTALEHIAITQPGLHESVSQTGGISLWGWLCFPWDLSFFPERYDGWSKSPGIAWLALGLPGLALAGRRARGLLAFGLSGLTAFYCFQRLARYIFPFFVPFWVGAAWWLRRPTRFRRPVQALMMIFFAFGLAVQFAGVHFKIPVALGLESMEDYLSRRVERYEAFRYANEHCARGGAVLSLDQRTYYLEAPAYQNHWALKRIARQSPEEQLSWLEKENIRYIVYPRDFVAHAGAIASDVGPMLDAWARDAVHFRLMTRMTLPGRQGGASEIVECYERMP